MSEETAPTADDPIAAAIIEMLADGLTPTFEEVAKRIAEERKKPKDRPDLWRRYLKAVRQQAIHLARAERIAIVRKGEAVDPNDFKGLVRICRPSKG